MTQRSAALPGQLNLFLHIIGAAGRLPFAADLFRFIDLHDTLHFTCAKTARCGHQCCRRCDGRTGFVRACGTAVANETGCALGVDIAIENISRWAAGWRRQFGCGDHADRAESPVVAGLPRARLMQLGLRLGADVPVFVFGENAFAEGVAKSCRLTRCRKPGMWCCFPGAGATRRFCTSGIDTRYVSITMRALLERQHLDERQLRNDLQSVACSSIRKWRVTSRG